MNNAENDMSHTPDPERRSTDEQPAHGLRRRSFLKLAGFTIAAAAAGCSRPESRYVVSSVTQEAEMTPGTSIWYATTCGACTAGCGLLVRARDNRPVKIEGLPEHPISQGGVCAVGQASLLELYDERRLYTPLGKGREIPRAAADREVMQALERIRNGGGRLRILSGTVTSPVLQQEIDRLCAMFDDAVHVQYDVDSASAALDLHERMTGVRLLPRPRFDRARMIVGFEVDFLASGLSPVEYASGWRTSRDLDNDVPRMARHVQFESRFSLTGGKADKRYALSGADLHAALWHLAWRIDQRSGSGGGDIVAPGKTCPVDESSMDVLADELWRLRGHGLVLCGVNDAHMQWLTAAANHALGSYGTTLDLDQGTLQRQGSDNALRHLRDECTAGSVDALVIIDANPVYDLPDEWKFGAVVDAVPLSVCFSSHHNETNRHAKFVYPLPHYLEDWRDSTPIRGLWTVTQPTIPPRKDVSPVAEILHRWTGGRLNAESLLRRYWSQHMHAKAETGKVSTAWRRLLRTGIATYGIGTLTPINLPAAPSPLPRGAASEGSLELIVYASPTLFSEAHACNAWLLELGDPVSGVSWDNCASLSPATAAKHAIEEGDVLRLADEDGGTEVLLPAHIQQGQADGVIAVAHGFGSEGTKRFTDLGPSWLHGRPSTGPNGRVGARISGLAAFGGASADAPADVHGMSVRVSKTGRRIELAKRQEYDFLAVPDDGIDGAGEKRPCVRETTLQALIAGHVGGAASSGHGDGSHGGTELSMWPGYSYDGHHWGMSIDLAACTGCSACVVSCQAENNIPVVGKDEVRRNRDLHWIRIDRYYHEDDDGETRMAFQPMLCHHCDNAPCETVCPVLATVHSEEGLNQQVYNRCVGTRYCANNCPYKVRRFNWFEYARAGVDELLLNPDVAVRSRGVMEKCSFCVQRIQEAKISAKSEGRVLREGDVRPACEQSCPTRAIHFGDMNAADGTLANLEHSPRQYRVLEELGIRPVVGYLMSVRNSGAGGKEDDNV